MPLSLVWRLWSLWSCFSYDQAWGLQRSFPVLWLVSTLHLIRLCVKLCTDHFRRPRSAGGAVGDVSADIARFCQVNRLQPRWEKTLSERPPHMALRVMGLRIGSSTFELSGDVHDPNAVVLARIRKARDQLSS